MLVGNSSKIIGNISSPEQINRQTACKNNVNFTSSASDLEQKVVAQLGKKSKFLGMFDKAGRMNSEIVNIIVNNIGTALVAPIFIAFNPISDQDKETKYYSAMRQPISGVLTVIAQFGINQKFNKLLDNAVYTKGLTKELDLSMKPSESYLKAHFKKQDKNISDEKLAENVANELKKRMEPAVKNKTDEIKSINAEELFKQLEINPDKLGKIDTKNHDAVKIATEKILKKDKKYSNMKDDIERFIANNDEKSANKLRLEYDNDFKTIVKDLKKNGESILSKRGLDISEFKAELAADKLARKLGISESENITKIAQNIKKSGGTEKFLEKCGLKEGLSKKTAENALKNLEHHLGEKGMLEKAAKAIVNNKVAFTESRLKAVKIFTGIALSLFTLPITCSALNWIYPRFMEVVFPNLVKSKKEGK